MSTPTNIPTEPMSLSQASTYQRLRAHLAELKLTTAAEHLPGVLEQATAEVAAFIASVFSAMTWPWSRTIAPAPGAAARCRAITVPLLVEMSRCGSPRRAMTVTVEWASSGATE